MLTAQPTPYQRIFDRCAYDRETTIATLRAYRNEVAVWGHKSDHAVQLRNRVVVSHMRAAAKLARRYHATNMEAADWLAYASLGLIRAVEMYDVDSGVAFITYATHWMRSSLSYALAHYAPAIRVPLSARQATREGYGITDDELHALRHASSLDACEVDGRPLSDRLPGESVDAESALDDDKQMRAAALAVAGLPRREREVLELRAAGYTLAESGHALGGVSRERIRQIETKAMRAARHSYARAMEPARPLAGGRA